MGFIRGRNRPGTFSSKFPPYLNLTETFELDLDIWPFIKVV